MNIKDFRTLLQKTEAKVWKDMETIGKNDPSYYKLNTFCLCMSYLSGTLNEMILDDEKNYDKNRFTYLYDKNNKPIYENNLVKTKYGRICKIVFKHSDCYHGWDMIPAENIDCLPPDEYDLWNSENLEIVD